MSFSEWRDTITLNGNQKSMCVLHLINDKGVIYENRKI
jgi:hypothetical protein